MTANAEANTTKRKRFVLPFAGGLIGLLIWLMLAALVVAGGFLIGGFLKFTDTVVSYQLDETKPKAEAIVVFTGTSMRLEGAARLLQNGAGKRLLISGVHPHITTEILSRRSGIDPELFSCCIDIDIQALDTRGNAVETAKWARKKDYNSLIVVTSAYHMPRSLLEIGRQLPDVKLIPHPVGSLENYNKLWYKDARILRMLLSEYSKYVAAQIRPVIADETFRSIRATMGG